MAFVPLLDDQGNRILDDQGNAILVDNGLGDSVDARGWWLQLIHVPWPGGDGSEAPPDPTPVTGRRWVWADGDTHTWANGEVSGFNEEP